MAMSVTQGFRLEDQYSFEKNAKNFMPFETHLLRPYCQK